jgi:hypothetical protein
VKFSTHRPSPALVISILALFVALGGVGMAATGDNFILGKPNSASQTTALKSGTRKGPTLRLTNVGAQPAASFVTKAGVAPFSVARTTRVSNLNADRLDGLNSTQFLRNALPLSLTGSTTSNGVITGTNTGSANGLQGVTNAVGASGVYGQNNAAGFGVAGRANAPGGVGVYAESVAGGPALAIHTVGAPPMRVDSSAKVDNLNADWLDGLDSSRFVVGDFGRRARLIANRLAPASTGQTLLSIPGMGNLIVSFCGGNRGGLTFDHAGTGNFDGMAFVLYHIGAGELSMIAGSLSTQLDPQGFATMNIARDTSTSTRIVTIWASWDANGCRFQAQAVESSQA